MRDFARIGLLARDVTMARRESFQLWREHLHADPEYQGVYDEGAAKTDLWLQLVGARQAAGLTQAELAQRLGVS